MLTITDGTITLLVILLIGAVAIAAYCMAKIDTYTEAYNKLVRHYNEAYDMGYDAGYEDGKKIKGAMKK
ncbi:hypothetical protein NHG29_04030 [Aerococcaceae bacterium NML160702]|nr:hypothetical protein [Aerococcaceae bacterium NML160702]